MLALAFALPFLQLVIGVFVLVAVGELLFDSDSSTCEEHPSAVAAGHVPCVVAHALVYVTTAVPLFVDA